MTLSSSSIAFLLCETLVPNDFRVLLYFTLIHPDLKLQDMAAHFMSRQLIKILYSDRLAIIARFHAAIMTLCYVYAA